jgi:hypothetical protein
MWGDVGVEERLGGDKKIIERRELIRFLEFWNILSV